MIGGVVCVGGVWFGGGGLGEIGGVKLGADGFTGFWFGFDGVVGGDGGAHLLDNFGAVTVGFRREVSGDLSRLIVFENVGGGFGFGDEFVANGRSILGGEAFFDRIALGVNDIGKEGEATTGFFFGEIFCQNFFDGFGSGDGDGGLALAWEPEALVGFCVEADEGGDVSFHGLVFAKRKSED